MRPPGGGCNADGRSRKDKPNEPRVTKNIAEVRAQQDPVPESDPLKRAAACAKAGDPVGMVTVLAEDHAMDGFHRQFSRRYNRLPGTVIEEAIAKATDKAYAQIQAGKKITSLAAWLWKVIENELNDAWTREYKYNATYDESRHAEAVRSHSAGGPEEQEEIDRGLLRTEAIRVAREIIPTLGQTNLVKVMTVVIDAVEAGVEDLSHGAIGKALDLNPATVRVLVYRGFDRLTRAARTRGLHLNRARLKELFPGFDDDEDDTDIQQGVENNGQH